MNPVKMIYLNLSRLLIIFVSISRLKLEGDGNKNIVSNSDSRTRKYEVGDHVSTCFF